MQKMNEPFSLLASLHPVLSAGAMREADRQTIEEFGIPGFTLMETAGRGAADAIEHRYGTIAGKKVTFFCGKGNNGGDGLVVARVLHGRGARVRIVTLAEKSDMSPDAAHNMDLLEQIAQNSAGSVEIVRIDSADQLGDSDFADLYVDALLGTGLTSALREPISGLVAWMNERTEPVVALDVPTGLHSDKGTVPGTAVRADLTVTMAAFKTGLLINDGPLFAGEIVVVEIGIPRFVMDRVIRAEPSGSAFRTTDQGIRGWLPRRSHQANKYSVGLALVVGGSPGLTGAPVMASISAARAGAGAVVCACQRQVQPLLATKMTEVMTLGLPESPDGGIDADGALEVMSARLEKARALLVGCGIGRHPDTRHFVRRLLEEAAVPVVVDADGLNALAGSTDLIARRSGGRWILTPHEGEFQRLTGGGTDLEDRVRVVQEYARKWNCYLLLKGMPSIVAGPDETAVVTAEHNPALATAGTGDVLAGLCTGFLAQGLEPLQAAAAALHLGGIAANRYASHRYAPTMLATDIIDQLPLVLKERFI